MNRNTASHHSHRPRARHANPGTHGQARVEVLRARRDARGVSAVEVAVLALIATALVVGTLSTALQTPQEARLERLEVSKGDTLWTLASAHPVDGLETAQVVDLISETNGLRGADLVPGTELLVPAATRDSRLVASR